jgi:hypothetical protein
MAITANNTTLTFNDATTQTTSAVTAVNVSTGISSSGGKTPTLTNTGVTSVAAGTGITVSASTGGVTITNSLPGAVSSVNGQTGAIVNTTFNSIGSYAAGSPMTNPSVVDYTAGSTVSGNTILQNTIQRNGPFATINSNAVPANQGQTGTWRAMGRSRGENDEGTQLNGSNLWVRVS